MLDFFAESGDQHPGGAMSIRKIVRSCLLFAIAPILLQACNTPRIDANALAGINTIALSGFADPEYGALESTGLLGREIRQSDTREDFRVLMARQNLHLGAELKAAVAQSLANSGYRVVETANASNADAVLDVRIWWAKYGTHEFSIGDYAPEVLTEVSLTIPKTRRPLYSHRYSYQNLPIDPIASVASVKRPDAKYAFKTQKDLFDNPQLAAEGFRGCEAWIAEELAAVLKKTPMAGAGP